MRIVILRGLPGSGKSTYAQKLANGVEGAVICSADDFHIDADGVYRFNRYNMRAAHEACFMKFKKAVDKGAPLVIVDNTNTQHWEFAKYLLPNAEVFRIVRDNSWQFNVHDVPRATFEIMSERFEDFEGETLVYTGETVP